MTGREYARKGGGELLKWGAPASEEALGCVPRGRDEGSVPLDWALVQGRYQHE